jgi:UbiD family decarboxylase
MSSFPISHAAPPKEGPKSKDLRGYFEENADLVTRITKPSSIDHIGALSAQSERPILFEQIIEYPDFRMCDILVKHRWSQCRALGVDEEDYLRTLAYRLRQPPRGFVNVETGPVKEVIHRGHEVDWTQLPVPVHSARENEPYITAMTIVRDPETGFYNSSHAGTSPLKPRSGVMSFSTPHTHMVMNKYRAMGHKEMPIALVFGVPPAYEIMANYSGLHMDMWGELEMVGTLMAQDVEMVPCEEIDLTVPAPAEIVVEGLFNIEKLYEYGMSVSPSGYYLPSEQQIPEVRLTILRRRQTKVESFGMLEKS